MGEKIESSVEYHKLSAKIGKFNEVQSALKEGYELLKGIREKYEETKDPEEKEKVKIIYDNFNREYNQLLEEIRNAYKSEKKITTEELYAIRLELGDLIRYSREAGFIESKSWWSGMGDLGKNLDTKEEIEKTDELTSMTIAEIKNKPELIPILLNYLNKNFRNINGDDAWQLFEVDSIAGIDSKAKAKSFQKQLMAIHLGETSEKGYGNNFVICNNQTHGLYLNNIPEFEEKIRKKDFSEVNITGLKGYVAYLNDNNLLDYKDLTSKFGSKTALQLLEKAAELSKDESSDGYTWDNVLGDIINTAKNYFEKIKGFLNSFTQANSLKETTEILTKGLNQYEKTEEKVEFLDAIKEDFKTDEYGLRNKFGSLFREELNKNKDFTEEEKDKKITELLNKIDSVIEYVTPNNFQKIDAIILAFEKENNLQIELGEFRNKFLQEYELSLEKELMINDESLLLLSKQKLELQEKIKTGNLNDSQKEAVEKILQKIEEKIKTINVELDKINQQKKDVEATKKAAKIVSDSVARQAYKEGNAEKIYNEKLLQARSQDKELDNYFKQYEQQKAEYEKKYPPIVEKKPEEIKKPSSLPTPENTLPTNTLTYNNTQINYIPSSNGNVTLDTGNKKIDITQDEFKIVENNQEALKNLINFKETLDELHIEKLWDFRDDIFNILRDEYPILFNENDTFLSEQEVIIFLNSVLASVDLKAYNSTHMDTLKSNFWLKNNISVLGGTNSENQVNGNTSIEQTFMNKFCPIMNNGRFESAKFRESIGNKK